MLILIFAVASLFLSFGVHILWWRIKVPVHATGTLLCLLLGVQIMAVIIYLSVLGSGRFECFPDVFRLVLLYSSCALVYVFLYSAIELQSPTLSIIRFIHSSGNKGCGDAELIDYLRGSDEINKRLVCMQKDGWVRLMGADWHLTKTGRNTAVFFECLAAIFGLRKGG